MLLLKLGGLFLGLILIIAMLISDFIKKKKLKSSKVYKVSEIPSVVKPVAKKNYTEKELDTELGHVLEFMSYDSDFIISFSNNYSVILEVELTDYYKSRYMHITEYLLYLKEKSNDTNRIDLMNQLIKRMKIWYQNQLINQPILQQKEAKEAKEIADKQTALKEKYQCL